MSVLLLGAFETCDSAIDFNPKMHGLFATFPHPSTGEELRGLLLPPLPERQAREDRAPAPPFWVEGDPTALEGYAANRAHVLRRLLVACGFDGSVTETVARSMHLVRFQVSRGVLCGLNKTVLAHDCMYACAPTLLIEPEICGDFALFNCEFH